MKLAAPLSQAVRLFEALRVQVEANAPAEAVAEATDDSVAVATVESETADIEAVVATDDPPVTDAEAAPAVDATPAGD